jgi:hypothetical protein
MAGTGKTNYNTSTYSGTGTSQDLSDILAPLASPTFTGTVNGITKAMVGLDQVDNTSDANKPVSTSTNTQLDLKAPKDSPTFTGTVTCSDISCNNLNAKDSNGINIATTTTASALTIGNSAVPTTIYGSSVNITYPFTNMAGLTFSLPIASTPAVGAYLISSYGNGSWPIFCSMKNFGAFGMEIRDGIYIVLPGYKINIWTAINYANNTYPITLINTIIDNSSGNFIITGNPQPQSINQGNSCNLYYKNNEITVSGFS